MVKLLFTRYLSFSNYYLMQIVLGVIFHFIGGFASGSFYMPFKKVKSWAWESYWIVGGIFSWLIVPPLAAWLTLPGFSEIIKSTSASTIQYTILFGVLWGICMGWLHPMHTVLFIGLTPGDARTEFMGIYIFCQQVLSWLPPLVFTILNEFGASMSIGLASLDIFFFIGLVCLQSIGRYDHLVSAVPTHDSTSPRVELPSVS